MNTAHWSIAHAACPCGCGYDGDALIDDETGEVITWKCNMTGARGYFGHWDVDVPHTLTSPQDKHE